ncbi:MAG: fumarylacetoacetate hydrolase family protein [Bacteroidales bacterium]|nr:fumarylacetoacetate hydrolase family protein [Bacteroidales bacterium]
MKIVRFKDSKDSIYWGELNGKEIIKLQSNPYDGIIKTEEIFKLQDIELLTPCTPTKIIGLGLNYKESYTNGEYPNEPILFLKGTNALIGHQEKIIYNPNIKYAWMEAELVIVIKKITKNITFGEAEDYIFGYTIGNDITAENIYNLDHHLARSKSIDTFSPIGPHIETKINTSDIRIYSWLNGKKIQKTTTANRINTDAEIVSKISKLITLYPGDIILTGTPPGEGAEHIMNVGIIHPGDYLKIEIEGIGILENEVI